VSEFRVRRTKEGLLLPVRLQPRASKTEICGCHGEWLKVRVCAPPLQGRANKECIELFADLLHVARGDLKVVAGEKGRDKQILIPDDSINGLKKIFKNLGISVRFDQCADV
jgi:uncharacterized protein (TIGR00251 family)